MKRQSFIITWPEGNKAIKHTWNASIREIERIIRGIAQEEGTTYTLTGSHSEKGLYGHVAGYRQWESMEGKIVMFDIDREK